MARRARGVSGSGGSVITVPPRQERDAMRSGLLLAAAKWEENVRIHGGNAFKRAAGEEAVKTGVHLLNPEMQAYHEQCPHEHMRQEQARERKQERAHERSPDRGMSIGWQANAYLYSPKFFTNIKNKLLLTLNV
jgi:hypothetical protein